MARLIPKTVRLPLRNWRFIRRHTDKQRPSESFALTRLLDDLERKEKSRADDETKATEIDLGT